MPIIKINVGGRLGHVRDDVRRLMDELFQVSVPRINLTEGWMPELNVCETEDALYVLADMAGVDTDSLSVVIDGSFLRMKGCRKCFLPKGNKRFYLMEIGQGEFERMIHLPVPVDSDSVDARYDNGLLIMRLPKVSVRESIRIHVD